MYRNSCTNCSKRGSVLQIKYKLYNVRNRIVINEQTVQGEELYIVQQFLYKLYKVRNCTVINVQPEKGKELHSNSCTIRTR